MRPFLLPLHEPGKVLGRQWGLEVRKLKIFRKTPMPGRPATNNEGLKPKVKNQPKGTEELQSWEPGGSFWWVWDCKAAWESRNVLEPFTALQIGGRAIGQWREWWHETKDEFCSYANSGAKTGRVLQWEMGAQICWGVVLYSVCKVRDMVGQRVQSAESGTISSRSEVQNIIRAEGGSATIERPAVQWES